MGACMDKERDSCGHQEPMNSLAGSSMNSTLIQEAVEVHSWLHLVPNMFHTVRMGPPATIYEDNPLPTTETVLEVLNVYNMNRGRGLPWDWDTRAVTVTNHSERHLHVLFGTPDKYLGSQPQVVYLFTSAMDYCEPRRVCYSMSTDVRFAQFAWKLNLSYRPQFTGSNTHQQLAYHSASEDRHFRQLGLMPRNVWLDNMSLMEGRPLSYTSIDMTALNTDLEYPMEPSEYFMFAPNGDGSDARSAVCTFDSAQTDYQVDDNEDQTADSILTPGVMQIGAVFEDAHFLAGVDDNEDQTADTILTPGVMQIGAVSEDANFVAGVDDIEDQTADNILTPGVMQIGAVSEDANFVAGVDDNEDQTADNILTPGVMQIGAVSEDANFLAGVNDNTCSILNPGVMQIVGVSEDAYFVAGGRYAIGDNRLRASRGNCLCAPAEAAAWAVGDILRCLFGGTRRVAISSLDGVPFSTYLDNLRAKWLYIYTAATLGFFQSLNFGATVFQYPPVNRALRASNGQRTTSENLEEQEENICCICYDNEANTILSPCKHMGFCGICAVHLASCPLCRSRVWHYTVLPL